MPFFLVDKNGSRQLQARRHPQAFNLLVVAVAVTAASLILGFADGQELDLAGGGDDAVCTLELRDTCSPCMIGNNGGASSYDCTLPGLTSFTPGQYAGLTVNYLSSVTDVSTPNFPVRAKEFEGCTGGKILFSEAANIFEDPVDDLGTKTSRGSELYDGYFMSYSHFPEVSALDLIEHLNDRIRKDNARLKWEDIMPKVKAMGEYRKNGATNIDFLMYDGDFFVPIIRLDLLEKFNKPLPNTWEEVVELAQFFNGTDLNDDGIADDYGFCHFPRQGAGEWDNWWPEALYSEWATYDQTDGMKQGFFFDEETMEPQLGPGFLRSAEHWKTLWKSGEGDCGSPLFTEGRCAIGYAPPGCWKAVFLNGVSRKDDYGRIIWKPTMKNGDYAEPYRFKPFGSTEVVDRMTGEFTPCTPELCPLAELVPEFGHHGSTHEDRSRVLPPSPLAGQLINRVPFYWSGGLGTAIRKSSPEIKKDMMWDFFVYTNSPETSVDDVARYSSWLDSWRFSQLNKGSNFLEGGWSQSAYEEHRSTQQWALSQDVNGAYNIRLPGVTRYTRDGVGNRMKRYFNDEMDLSTLLEEVVVEWNEITNEQGKLDQLATYRASLGLDELPDFDLCQLHRPLMDERDPSVCRKYDPVSGFTLLIAIVAPSAAVIIIALVCLYKSQKRRAEEDIWKIKHSELKYWEPPEVLGRGTFGLVFLAEYRGTQVAVKRVIPPKPSGYSGSGGARTSYSSTGWNFSAYASDLEAQGVATGGSSGSIDLAPQEQASQDKMVVIAGDKDNDEDKTTRKSTISESKLSNGKSMASMNAEYTKLKEEFLHEMRELAKLRHPCITTVMGAVLEKNSEPLLVMEYMDHGSLHDVLHNKTFELDGEIILPILRDIAQGVRFLHAADPQIVHSDLKASNILVDSRFRAKVADFGLSQKQKLGAVGTPYWLAPEVLRGETPNTTESDAYAFGMILYEVYSRKDPYEGEKVKKVLAAVADDNIKKRPPVPTTCPPKAQVLMCECLESDPKKRPTFEELDLQLKRLDVSTMDPVGIKEAKQSRTDALLFEVFPKHVAEALRDGRKVEPMSRDLVTVFFCDIVGYTNISSTFTPHQVADLLRRLYTSFDELSSYYGVKKIETIGDSYMAVTNLTEKQDNDHARRIAEFSIAAIEAANGTLIDSNDPSRGTVDIRVGFSSGPVVADVVGSLSPRVSHLRSGRIFRFRSSSFPMKRFSNPAR